jgi:protocatechuate 3,4-dioxygenase beta subunit
VATASAGTVTGGIAGPSLAEVDAIVFFGPDNILREAARVIPDERGRFEAHALLPGSYRIVAAGKRGRVLICDPPFITIRVSSNGAIEAPVLNVIRAQ